MSITREMTPDPARARRSPLASSSIGEHLLRGAASLVAAVVAIVLVSVVGPVSLVLLPLAAVAWRGCPRLGRSPRRPPRVERPFQQQDADALAAITGAIARGIRTSLRFDAARRINGLEATGLVILGPGDEVEMITPPARELLASIAANDLAYTDDDMPAAVLSLAGFVRSAPHAAQGGANVVTVPAKDSWVTLHASRPGTASDGRVAIVIERASAARSATVRLEAFGATAREREVATLLARGLSRVEIAESLVLSPHTVEDHTKSLYDKVGVASRQELVARVFLDEYLPEVAQSTPLTSRGRFDRV